MFITATKRQDTNYNRKQNIKVNKFFIDIDKLSILKRV